MEQCTHEVRAEHWKGLIKACGQRPAGQSAKNWMDENGICEQSYYHWQQKFRQKAYEKMQKNRPMIKDHYEEIEYILHPRPVVMENIEKMIYCEDPSYELKFVPFRYHSKFCPTYSNKYCIDRSTKMSFKLIDCTHRHLVFTIDEDLRPFFLGDCSLLDCLFQSVRSVILGFFHELNKSRNFVPGFVCVLHTFGRPLALILIVPPYSTIPDSLVR